MTETCFGKGRYSTYTQESWIHGSQTKGLETLEEQYFLCIKQQSEISVIKLMPHLCGALFQGHNNGEEKEPRETNCHLSILFYDQKN
jgi:hypothetical protein